MKYYCVSTNSVPQPRLVLPLAPPAGDAVVSPADLELFLRDWFLRDPDLARRHAPNKAVNGLQPKAYWVRARKRGKYTCCGLFGPMLSTG